MSYIHAAPMPQVLAAYIWPDGLQIKDLTLESIRQALTHADEVNLRMFARHVALPCATMILQPPTMEIKTRLQ